MDRFVLCPGGARGKHARWFLLCRHLALAGLIAAAVLYLFWSHAHGGDSSGAAPPALAGAAAPLRRRKRGDLRLRQATQLRRLFRGRDDHVAVAQGKGFAPERLTEPLSVERLAEEHLAGVRCLGFYLMTPDNKVWCSCIDLDNKADRPNPKWKKHTEMVYRFLAKHGLSLLVEVSQSGSAAHAWMFLSQPVPARLIRAFWKGVLDALGIPVPEIYPRQNELTGKGLGNLVRYPLWNKSHFVDVTAGWKRLPPIKTMSAVSLVSVKQLKQVAIKIGIDLNAEPEKKSLPKGDAPPAAELPARVKGLLEHDERLAARWGGDTEGLADTSRSALLMSIACMLVRRYVPTPEIEAAIRFWCVEHHYEKGRRDDWVTATIACAYDFVGSQSQNGRRRFAARLPKDTPEVIRKSFEREVARRAGNKTRRVP